MTPDRAALEAAVLEHTGFPVGGVVLRHVHCAVCAYFTAALATPPAPADSMPEEASLAWHADRHSPESICSGCANHIGWHMARCRCPEAPWCVPHPSDGYHQWRWMCRLPHDHVATPPAPEAAAVERCAGFHEFDLMTCKRCGAVGRINLSIVGEDERLDITKAEPAPTPPAPTGSASAEALRTIEALRAAFRAADGATRWGGPWTLGDIEAVLDAASEAH